MKVRRPVDFSSAIKTARAKSGINQAELASLCGTTQSAISRVEKTGACQLDTLLRICAVLDLIVDISPRDESEPSSADKGLW